MTYFRSLRSQWLASGYVAVVSILVTILVARVLGPEQFGTYSYVMILASLFHVYQDGGYKTLIFREGTLPSGSAMSNSGGIVGPALGHVLAVTAIAVGGLAVVVQFVSVPVALIYGIVCFAFVTLTGFVSADLKARGEFHREAAWQASIRTLSALAIVSALLVGIAAPEWLFVAWTIALAIALSLPMARVVRRTPEFRNSTGYIKTTSTFIVIEVATLIYFRSDIVLLTHLGGDPSEVGEYAAIYRILDGLILFATPMAHMAFRQLRVVWEDPMGFRRRMSRMFIATICIAVVVYGVSVLVGPRLIPLAFGAGYERAATLLPWVLLALFFVFPNYILTQGLIALNRERSYAIVAILAAVVSVSLNLAVIPHFGAQGAAVTTVITEAALFVALIVVYSRLYTHSGTREPNAQSARSRS